MERKKRSKGRGCESCYVKKIYGTFGVEMRAYGQKLVQFCKHTHTHAAPIVVQIYVGVCTVVDKPNIINGRRKVCDLPVSIGGQRKTHRSLIKILLYQLCFIIFDISKFHLQ